MGKVNKVVSLFQGLKAVITVKADSILYALTLGVHVAKDVCLISLRPGIGSKVFIGAVVPRDMPDGSVVFSNPTRVITTVDENYQPIECKKDNVRLLDSVEKCVYLERKFGCE